MYEIIKKLCKQNGVSVNKLEQDLQFAKGSLCRIDKNKPSIDKLQKIADYFGVSTEYILKGVEGDKYYLNEETAKVAQDIFEHKELRLLFSAARDAEPEDLEAVHAMLLALKRKERGEID